MYKIVVKTCVEITKNNLIKLLAQNLGLDPSALRTLDMFDGVTEEEPICCMNPQADGGWAQKELDFFNTTGYFEEVTLYELLGLLQFGGGIPSGAEYLTIV